MRCLSFPLLIVVFLPPFTLPPLYHHLVPLLAVAASLSDLYPGPRRQADTFTIHARLQYLMAKFVVAVAVTTPHCGRGGGQCDSVAVRQWGTVVRQSQSLLSSSYSSQWRCLVAISLSFRFGKLFFRLPCAPPSATPLWLLLTVSLGIAGCCRLLAACCWRYVNRYHLLSLRSRKFLASPKD